MCYKATLQRAKGTLVQTLKHVALLSSTTSKDGVGYREFRGSATVQKRYPNAVRQNRVRLAKIKRN